MLMETQTYNFSDCGQSFFPIEWSSVEDNYISGQFCYFVTYGFCDVSTLHIGYILGADQLSVFVHTERLHFISISFSLSVGKKNQTTDQLSMCNKFVTLKRLKPYMTK